MMGKYILILVTTLLCSLTTVYGQARKIEKRETPSLSIETNLLSLATTSLNLGIEFKVAKKMTLQLPLSYNPWTFSKNRKFKHILFQPELRWWTCEPFNGSHFGLHTQYAFYNVGGYGSKYMRDHRFQGWLTGVGVSYGYQFYLAPRWNLGLDIGAGYSYLHYDRYSCERCGEFKDKKDKHYFGISKISLSIVYIIK